MTVPKKYGGKILTGGIPTAVAVTIAVSTAPAGSNTAPLLIMLTLSLLAIACGVAVFLFGTDEPPPQRTREQVHGDFCEAVGDVISRAVAVHRRSGSPKGPPATWEEAEEVYTAAMVVPQGLLNAESLDAWTNRMGGEWSRYGPKASRTFAEPRNAIAGVLQQLRRMRNEFGVVAMTLGEKR